jgi:hypothetical protein
VSTIFANDVFLDNSVACQWVCKIENRAEWGIASRFYSRRRPSYKERTKKCPATRVLQHLCCFVRGQTSFSHAMLKDENKEPPHNVSLSDFSSSPLSKRNLFVSSNSRFFVFTHSEQELESEISIGFSEHARPLQRTLAGKEEVWLHR